MEENKVCPGCLRHCEKGELNCGRGEAIRVGELKPEGGHGGPDRRPPDGQASAAQQLAFLLNGIGRMGRFALEPRDAAAPILDMLEGHRGWMTEQELARRLGPRGAGLSQTLLELEKPGWITRTAGRYGPNPEVHITKAGRTRTRELGMKRGEQAEEAFRALSEEEQKQLASLLEKLSGDWRERFLPKRGRANREKGMQL
ncbi:MAG: hypothetical protein J5633_07520 [Oscillospiraceae bacterium]|nr:hypothetical protein [Oscillospiraceae bacterium]